MLNIIQVIISVFLVAGILLQQQGEGLSPTFGGGGGGFHVRRGAEKSIFTATIFLAVAFFVVAILQIILR